MWTEIKNTKIISNYGAGSGGVHLFQNGENVLFENVLIADNQSQWGPGGIHSFSVKFTCLILPSLIMLQKILKNLEAFMPQIMEMQEL